MNKADCFNLGYVAKLHGFKGEVSLFFDTNNPEHYANLDAVYIELNGILTPFFIDQINLREKGFAKVKFEGVDTENDAKALLRKELFLPLEILPKLSGPHFYDHEIVGFTVMDERYGEVGEVVQIIDYVNNPLLQIFNKAKAKEVLMPLANDLIKLVDRENKIVHVNAIEGIIELYLED